MMQWSEIQTGHTAALAEVLRLYDQVFPIEVREPHDVFWSGLRYAQSSKPNTFRFLVGYEKGELASFATGHYLAGVNAGFIVYIAVNPAVRAQGMGSRTLVELERRLGQDAAAAGHASLSALFLEAEKEELAHTEEEREACRRRNGFFARHGYLPCETAYLQPPLHEGEQAVPLTLFQKGSVPIEAAVRAMYREKYAAVNGIEREVLGHCLAQMGIDW